MGLRPSFEHPVGVIGAGRFGLVVANLLAEQTAVLLYSRDPRKAAEMTATRMWLGRPLHPRIRPTSDLSGLVTSCETLFPIVPAAAVRALIDDMAPLLRPYHRIIHGTKGFALRCETSLSKPKTVTKDDVQTISAVIRSRSQVLRIGCLSGPNISEEIAEGLPAATIIASHYDEVIAEGERLLKNDRFLVYGSRDLIGVELCGVLKNIIAIAAGLMDSLSLGNNAKAFLISRGMGDVVRIGRLLGGSTEAFLGLAGVGDVITSCYSPRGRNFRVGQLLAQGYSIADIEAEIQETTEGIRTVEIIVQLARRHRVRCLVAEVLHKIMHRALSIERARQLLMKLPFAYDWAFQEE